ncbi:MAG TPA: FtsX-like permease family protein [Acidimicrobiales bacterium]|nr:FtsX-like permease family protein [Acidimicrobiales bacterium]
MFRTALKDLAHRKLRLVATAVAVVLGVAFVAGTYVLTDTVSRSFDDLFASVDKTTDVVVRSARTVGDDGFGGQKTRAQISDSFVKAVASVPGVRSAQGHIQGYAQLLDQQGDPIGNPRNGAPVLGLAWDPDPTLNPFRFVAGGPPHADGQVVIDKRSADKGPFKVGDPIGILTQVGQVKATVVGIARFGSANSPGGASVALFNPPQAARVLGQPGKVDSVLVAADPGISQTTLASRIQHTLPGNLEAVTGAKITKEDQDSVKSFLGFFSTFLLVFGIVALIVGAFIIVNTFSIIVGQRTRELALMRALGATSRQVMASVLVEALAVGVIASAAGLGLGILAAAGLRSLLASFGVEFPPAPLVVATRTVVVSVLIGTVITLLSALFPARKAARVAPIEAMRAVEVDDTGHSKMRLAVGIVLIGIAALLVGSGVSGSNPLRVGLGAGVTLLSFVVLGPILSNVLGTVIGTPIAWLRGISGQLAKENTVRNPRRTASTASALMIGVALVAFITVFASSVKASLNDTITNNFRGDFVVSSKALVLPDQLVTKLDALPQLQHVVAMAEAQFTSDVASRAMATDPAAFAEIFHLDIKQGSLRHLGVDGMAVTQSKADQRHLQIGSKVHATYIDGSRHTFTVRAIVADSGAIPSAIIDQRAAVGANRQSGVDQILVKDAPGVGADRAHAAIKKVIAGYPVAEVQTAKEFADGIGSQLNGMLNMVYALLALAVLIALVGIANTLGLSILERTRELGVLRAVGMSRAQVRSTIRWEAVLIAAAGTVLGLALGLGASIAVLEAIPSDQGLTSIRIPFQQLINVAIIGVVVGIIASIWPGRRAAKLDVLQAIATE